jgi:hypothetical protein
MAPLPNPILFCESLLTPTSYKDPSEVFYGGHLEQPTVIDFTNMQITVVRLTNPEFRRSTTTVDHFVPESMPLTRCINSTVGKTVMHDRVYGPELISHFLKNLPQHRTSQAQNQGNGQPLSLHRPLCLAREIISRGDYRESAA